MSNESIHAEVKKSSWCIAGAKTKKERKKKKKS